MIHANREQLLAALNTVQRITGKSLLPILDNVLITASADSLQLTCTDIESQVTTSCQAEFTGDADPFTVSVKKLHGICKSLAEGSQVNLATFNEQVTISAGRSRFNLVTLPATDFPNLDRADFSGSFLIDASALKALMANAETSMAKNDARYYLNGMLLQVESSKLNVVATNGHRLACWDFELVEAPDCTMLIPCKFAQNLLRELPNSTDSVRVEYGHGFCRFKCADTILTSKLIDGKYPDYQRVIPRQYKYSGLINNAELRGLLYRAAVLKNQWSGVKLTFTPGTLAVEAVNQEKEQFNDCINAEFSGDESVIGLSADYLAGALNALQSETVAMELGDGTDPMLLRDPDNANKFHVLMPMRL